VFMRLPANKFEIPTKKPTIIPRLGGLRD
jgi:hypothetical protein